MSVAEALEQLVVEELEVMARVMEDTLYFPKRTHLSGSVGLCRGTVGLCWVLFYGSVGALLGLCWARLGFCWALLGLFWALLGLCWALLGLCWALGLGPLNKKTVLTCLIETTNILHFCNATDRRRRR